MKTLLFAVGTFALIGCKGFTPVGPLAKYAPAPQQSKPLSAAPPEAAAAAKAPAIRPTPPTMLVTPGEVTADNTAAVAAELEAELAADGKATVNAPVTVETSRYKGGVKQP